MLSFKKIFFFAGAHFASTLFFLFVALSGELFPEGEPNLIRNIGSFLFQVFAFIPLGIANVVHKTGLAGPGLNNFFEWLIFAGNSLLWGLALAKITLHLKQK